MASVSPLNNLPREVLRWVQGLDLAYSVKNVKRDFSNGFLVAEMISRYYAREISMHSFDNGTSMKAKRDNWAQLVKMLRKVGLADLINEQEAFRIICCEDGCAIDFIIKLYETLTQRTIQKPNRDSITHKIPGYAKDISLSKIRMALKHHNLIDENDDIQTVTKVAAIAAVEHEKSLQEERFSDPERYMPTNSASIMTRNSQLAPKLTSEIVEDDGPQITVKEIQVKQLDRNVTHLRASKQTMQWTSPQEVRRTSSRLPADESPLASPASRVSHGSGEFQGEANGFYTSLQGASTAILTENVLSLLNTCIGRVLGAETVEKWDDTKDPVQNLLQLLTNIRCDSHDDGMCSRAFYEIRASAAFIADAAVVAPKQFWCVADLYSTAYLSVPFNSKTFTAAVESFTAIGHRVAKRDPRSSVALLLDFWLAKLTPLLVSNPNKRLGLLTVLFAFSPADTQSHILCIKRIQELVPDLNVFICCLSILANFEAPATLDDALLDLYLYYANIGLKFPSPKVRSCSVNILSLLLPLSVDKQMISQVLMELLMMAQSERWWEFNANLLKLVNNLYVRMIYEGDASPIGDTIIATLLNILTHVLKSDKSLNIRIWASVALAPAATCKSSSGDTDHELLCRAYVDVLTKLPEESRNSLLNNNERGSNIIPLPASNGIPFVIDQVPNLWQKYTINIVEALLDTLGKTAKAIRENGETVDISDDSILSGLQRLDLEFFEIINASVGRCVALRGQNSSDEILDDAWLSLFEILKGLIFQGITDSRTVGLATSVIKYFIGNSSLHASILQDTKLMNSMKILYPLEKSNERLSQAQGVFEQFLLDVFNIGEQISCRSGVIQLLNLFSTHHPQQFQKSLLPRILKECVAIHHGRA